MNARAVRDVKYVQQRQWLSGYHAGYEPRDVWRVELKLGPTSFFMSKREYASESSAKAAANRINGAKP